jgi:hypothetical protein
MAEMIEQRDCNICYNICTCRCLRGSLQPGNSHPKVRMF